MGRWRARWARSPSPDDPAAVERQRSRGKLLARERIEQLLDPGSFQELHMLRRATDVSSLNGKQAYGDGIVGGWGTIEGRLIFVFSQDPTVVGGSLGEVGGAKVHKVLDLAIDAGAPVIGISDGGGARIQEGVASLVAFGGIFLRNTFASGVVPQISLIMGVATGGAVYSPALTDFVFMVEGTATMAITGPKVVKQVTGEDVTLEDLGGASVHAKRSGVVHFVVSDERSCLEQARKLLRFLPQNNRQEPPVTASVPPSDVGHPDPLAVLPDEVDAPYDARRLISTLVDASELLEYATDRAPNIVCGLARFDGRPTGVIANQPAVSDGRLDIASCDKAARFVQTCDAFNLGVVTIIDCPGFIPGIEQEHGGVVRAAAKMAHAYASATGPKVHLIIGQAHVGAMICLGATQPASGIRLAWPTMHITALERVYGPHDAAVAGGLDKVIEPQETRATLIDCLAMLRTIKKPCAPRKHENSPL